MKFAQIIDYTTKKPEEIEALQERYRNATEGKRTTGRVLFLRDRDVADHYLAVVEFASYEEAMRNNELPETAEFAEKMAELCDGPVSFVNTDVLSVDES